MSCRLARHALLRQRGTVAEMGVQVVVADRFSNDALLQDQAHPADFWWAMMLWGWVVIFWKWRACSAVCGQIGDLCDACLAVRVRGK